ncbi:MAG: DNA primase, partial [Clostridiales bacterium]|nr:DNA primase [Clostridiales bacterium]
FALCPFHSEDTPSFSVSAAKQIFYCFGCHKGGNVIQFIMEIEKLSFIEALKVLAERAQIALPEPKDDALRKSSVKRDQIREALVEAARYFYNSLHSASGKEALEYLAKRKISDKTAKMFGLGYAPNEWEGLYKHLHGKEISDEILQGCGLFTKSKKGGLIDLFRGRLMFPIFDPMGKIVAFGGRILTDATPKYINSPETDVYSKQRVLYGLNFAKSSKEKSLIIVEGYMDVISMHQAGVGNAVASLGTALTDRQLILASRYAEEIVLFFDSDNAGRNAAVRSLKALMTRMNRPSGSNARLSVGMVPDGKDPDQFIREHGADAFREVVSNALPVMEYLVKAARIQSTVDGRFDARMFQTVACEYLSWESNAVLRERAAGRVAEILKVSVASVLTETTRIEENGRKSGEMRPLIHREKQISVASSDSTDRANRQELVLLCLLCANPDVLQNMPDKPIPTDFSSGTMREIATDTLSMLYRGQAGPVKLLELAEGKELNGKPARDLFSEILFKTKDIRDEDKLSNLVLDCLYRVRRDVYRRRQQYLSVRIDGMPEGKDREATQTALLEVNEYLKFLRAQIKDLSK